MATATHMHQRDHVCEAAALPAVVLRLVLARR